MPAMPCVQRLPGAPGQNSVAQARAEVLSKRYKNSKVWSFAGPTAPHRAGTVMVPVTEAQPKAQGLKCEAHFVFDFLAEPI